MMRVSRNLVPTPTGPGVSISTFLIAGTRSGSRAKSEHAANTTSGPALICWLTVRTAIGFPPQVGVEVGEKHITAGVRGSTLVGPIVKKNAMKTEDSPFGAKTEM